MGALGKQGLAIIRSTADVAERIDREALRAQVEEASVRPAPGTSELLSEPLSCRLHGGVGRDGKVRPVLVYDLLAMAPIHLKRDG